MEDRETAAAARPTRRGIWRVVEGSKEFGPPGHRRNRMVLAGRGGPRMVAGACNQLSLLFNSKDITGTGGGFKPPVLR